ncbi:MAG TPA: hypothetical protein VG324_08885 [Blastocatellia bacterium]|nr:hypothetical protein [Blastocatellia bacterium]
MNEDQVDEIVSAAAATIEAEVEKMISALPDGFVPTRISRRQAS